MTMLQAACKLALIVLYLTVICVLRTTHGYNLGTGRSVVLQGAPMQESYFGFSIAIFDEDNIFVGSPRDNDTDLPDVDRPGRLYRCNSAGICTPLHIDNRVGSQTVDGVNVFHGKDNQWLGATIALPPTSQRGIVTCAHRWYNAAYVKEHDNYMKGLCYEVPTDLTQSEIVTLISATATTNYTVNVDGQVFYRYAFSQMGSSAHFSRKDADLLLGAPGVNQWTGGFVKVEQSRSRRSWKYLEQDLSKVKETQSQYAGYAVTSGVFFSDDIEYYAVGMPRADLVGQVLLYKSTRNQYMLESPDMVLQGVYSGSNKSLPVNSFFGSVLCAADFTGDSRDELLVGAPLYASTGHVETGMVHVYVGAMDRSTFTMDHPVLLGDASPSGRFGMAISNIGDINSDRFNDVAIGAPYADDMRGRVYIYNGYRDGVWPRYSQLISASDIGAGFVGFGAAISNGRDINGDTVNDVAIGAFLNDSAVLLFGQPVIDLSPSLSVRRGRVQIWYLQPDENMATVKVCFIYIFRQCNEVTVTVTLTLDADKGDSSRLVFADNLLPTREFNVTLFHSDEQCVQSSNIIARNIQDVISPIRIIANYSMPDSGVRCSTPVPPISKQFDGGEAANFTHTLEQSVFFYNNCPNNTCTTDLHLSVSAQFTNISQFFILGTDDLTLTVKIKKSLQSSYGSVMQLVLPNYIRYKRFEKDYGQTDITCFYSEDTKDDAAVKEFANDVVEQSQDERMLSCPFGNPMTDNNGVGFRIHLQVPVELPVSTFTTRLSVSSLSTEHRTEDNSRNLTFPLRRHSELSFLGVPLDESIRNEGGNQQFEHLHALENHGPSPLPEVTVSVYHPYSHRGGNSNLFLMKSEVKCRWPCEVTCHVTEPSGVPNISVYINGKKDIWRPQNTLEEASFTDCRQKECPHFQCVIRNIPADHSAEVALTFSINGHFPDDTLLVSRAVARVNISGTVATKERMETQVTTRFLTRLPEPEGVAWWIIVVSILCGLILIILIIFILYKVGFFKRHTRDAMQQRLTNGQSDMGNDTKKDPDSFTDSENDKLEGKDGEVKI